MTDKEIFIEKLTEPIPKHYLCFENHTNYCMVSKCETWMDVEKLMEDEEWNFLGISIPPYNTYGEQMNYAFVIEDKINDYKIMWHHISEIWLNKIAKSLDIDFRFGKCKTASDTF